MAGGLLRILGTGKTRDQIRVVDKTTEKIAIVPDQKIQAQNQVGEQAEDSDSGIPVPETETGVESDQTQRGPYVFAEEDENTAEISGKYTSKAMILIDLETGKIIAQKKPEKQILPTALTKVMTALVAIENLTKEQMEQSIVMSQEAKDFCKTKRLGKTNIKVGAEVTVLDLIYGTIVPAGADACFELANAVAGSQEAFTEMMNEKAQGLGLSENTFFTNTAGSNEKGHYSSVKDLAIIMKAAYENSVLRPILETQTFKVDTTPEKGDEVVYTAKVYSKLAAAPGTVVAAKSGYTEDSGACALTLFEASSGKQYICVTAGAESADKCAAEHISLRKKYTE